MSANDRQVGGEHYKSKIQHWDFVVANDLDYFQGQITLYVTRWKKKGGIEDLEKGLHFYEKYLEIERAKLAKKLPLPNTEELPSRAYRSMNLTELANNKPNEKAMMRPTGMHTPFGFNPEED